MATNPQPSATALSLAARISLVVAALLALAAGVTGYAIYASVRKSLNDEIESRLNERLSWLQGSIEADETKLEMETNQPSPPLNDQWQVALLNGKVLWSSNWNAPAPEASTKTKLITMGDADGPRLSEKDIVNVGGTRPFGPGYRIPAEHRSLELRLTVRTPSAHTAKELKHLSLALWTLGPLAVLLLSGILAFFIKRQLRPLEQMSLQAAAIGPQSMSARIGPSGTSAECVRMRAAINGMIERLVVGLERERNFASVAAHELRTPVAQLRTTIEVALRKDRDSDEYRSALTHSLTDVERMQKLIENLLFLTRNHQGLEQQPSIPLARVITVAQRGLSNPTSTTLDVDGIHVRGNEELLVCGIRNVLENAARYAPASLPDIRASKNGDTILLTIADLGPGIPDTDRERIFEPLVRLDQARSIGEAADGFGLGLTVARAAIRACGGNLICRSRPDKKSGAEFVFELTAAATT